MSTLGKCDCAGAAAFVLIVRGSSNQQFQDAFGQTSQFPAINPGFGFHFNAVLPANRVGDRFNFSAETIGIRPGPWRLFFNLQGSQSAYPEQWSVKVSSFKAAELENWGDIYFGTRPQAGQLIHQDDVHGDSQTLLGNNAGWPMHFDGMGAGRIYFRFDFSLHIAAVAQSDGIISVDGAIGTRHDYIFAPYP